MRWRKKSYIVIALIVATIISGCSRNKADNMLQKEEEGKDSYSPTYDMTEEIEPEEELSGLDSGNFAEDKLESTTNNNQVSEAKNNNQKLIRRFIIDVETQEFDSLLSGIRKKIQDTLGYIESSEISGRSYGDNSLQYATMIVRIPKQSVDEFVHAVDKLGNVVNTKESAEDVTLAYVDAESRQKALEVQQERLLEILSKAEKIADIIELEERLSDVRYELESYATTIRTYDNLVDYSTVTLHIDEVKRMTIVKEETILDQMSSGISDTLYDIKTWMQNVAIKVVVNLPYIVIWTIIILIGIFGGKRIYKKKVKKVLPNNVVVDQEDRENK